MKNKGLLIFGALTALAVGYAIYDVAAERKEATLKAEQSRVIPFEADQVNQVEILVGGRNEKIKLQRSQGGWRIEEPLQELADQNAVTDFVESALSEKAEAIKVDSEPTDWKVYGLDSPKGQIVLQNNLGEKKTIAVSTKKNFQGDSFLRRDQEPKPLAANSTWFTRLEKSALDFRDKRLLRKPMAQIERFQFSSKSGSFSLKYDQAKWEATDRPNWKLDQNKVRDFLAILTNAVITEFVKESAATIDEQKKWGFKDPRAKIELTFRDATTWTALLARDADKNNFVQISDPAFVVKVPAAEAEKISALQLDVLRDRREPFEFNKQEVKKIRLSSGHEKKELELKGDQWVGAAASQGQPALDSQQVEGLLVKLSGLEVAEFIDQKIPLEKEKMKSIALLNQQGSVVLEISLGEKQKKKVNGQDRSLVLAKTNLFNDTLTIDEGSVQALGLEKVWAPTKGSESEKK